VDSNTKDPFVTSQFNKKKHRKFVSIDLESLRLGINVDTVGIMMKFFVSDEDKKNMFEIQQLLESVRLAKKERKAALAPKQGKDRIGLEILCDRIQYNTQVLSNDL
jgi:hypothetical protein